LVLFEASLLFEFGPFSFAFTRLLFEFGPGLFALCLVLFEASLLFEFGPFLFAFARLLFELGSGLFALCLVLFELWLGLFEAATFYATMSPSASAQKKIPAVVHWDKGGVFLAGA
jgi:hypothetical protein